jgi:hypothetical protein
MKQKEKLTEKFLCGNLNGFRPGPSFKVCLWNWNYEAATNYFTLRRFLHKKQESSQGEVINKNEC